MNERRCHACREVKQLEAFPRHRSRPLGRGYACLVCMRAKVKAWSKTARGKERQKIYKRKYRTSARGREKERAFAQRPEQKGKASARRIRRRNTVAGRYTEFSQWLNRRYGMDVEDWARMYDAQDRRCAGCRCAIGVDRGTHVDHCHATGKVRGLLCRGCNTALGSARDSPETLKCLARYLEEANATRATN